MAALIGSQPARNDGLLTREVNTPLLWPGDQVTVKSTLHSDQLPACAAPQAADVLLLIDRSSSMDGAPLEAGLSAAGDFVKTLDLSVHQVGIVLFNGAVTDQVPLTQDRARLLGSLENLAGVDGTRIDLALAAARAELTGPNHRAAAQPMVILLSDGGSADPPATTQEATLDRQQGISIVTIELVGTEPNRALMQEMASSPAEYYPSPGPAALGSIYRLLAQGVQHLRGTQASVTEKYDAAAFDLVSAPVTVTGSSALVMNIGALTDQPRSFEYVLAARGLGWPLVNPQPGEIKLNDCNNVPLVSSSPPGPRVMVLAPLGALLVLLGLIPLFLFGAWILPVLRRKPAQPPEETRPAPPLMFSPEPPRLDWARELQGLDEAPPARPPARCQAALMVGLGRAGRYTLTAVKRNLLERYGKVPDEIRLLQIDAVVQGETVPAVEVAGVSLDQEEELTLLLDVDDVDKTLKAHPEGYDYLRWWPRDMGADRGRALGRMAVFYDLRNDIEGSKLWHTIVQRHPRKSCRLFLIASLADDVGSGAYLNVADLVKRATKSLAPYIRTDALLALNDTMGEYPNASQAEAAQAKTFAALRELARFRFTQKIPIVYNPRGDERLRTHIETSVLDGWYLFSGRSAAVDMTKAGPANGALASIADCLTLLTDPDSKLATQLNDHLKEVDTTGGQIQALTGEALVSSMGSFVYEILRDDLRRACEYRLIQDVLFNPDSQEPAGLVKLVRDTRGRVVLDLHADREDEADYAVAVLAFLRDSHLQNYHVFWGFLADALENQVWDERRIAEQTPTDPRLAALFQVTLQDQLNRILNGTSRDPVVSRTGKLVYALGFLAELKDALERVNGLAIAARHNFEDLQLFNFICQAIEECSTRVDAAIAAGEAWRRVLVNLPDRPLAQGGGPKKTGGPASLFDLVSDGLQVSRQTLAEARQNLPEDYVLDEKLEQPYYAANVAPGKTGDVVRRMLDRIGWVCDGTGERMQLRLIILPARANKFSQPLDYAYGPDQLKPVLEELLQLAQVFSRGVADETLAGQFGQRGVKLNDVAERLARASLPMLHYGGLDAPGISKSIPVKRFLFAPRTPVPDVTHPDYEKKPDAAPLRPMSAVLNKLIDNYVARQSLFENLRGETVPIESDEPQLLAILGSAHLIPLSALELGDMEQYYYQDPALHVFPAEQAAVTYERRLRDFDPERHDVFHPLFVRLLDDVEAARRFAAGWAFGLVKRDAQTHSYHLRLQDPTLDLELGSADGSLFDAMEAFTVTLPIEQRGNPAHPLGAAQSAATMKQIDAVLGGKRKQKKSERTADLDLRKKEIVDLQREAEAGEGLGQKRWLRDLISFLTVALEDERSR